MAKENVEAQEKGDIFFFYRPKIDVKDDISSENDIENFYLVLSPKGDKHVRLIIIGREQLPSLSGNEKFWGFVSKSSTSKKQIREVLESTTYETKTRGERERAAARPCGEGVYRVLTHEDHTHLVFALELPKDPDRVQNALNIKEVGNYILSVKNPEKGQPVNAGLSEDQKADFPKKLQEKFQDRRFIPVEPADFLNYDYAELMFIGVDKDIRQELGISLDTQKESKSNADIFNDLKLDKEENPVKPLFEGEEWV